MRPFYRRCLIGVALALLLAGPAHGLDPDRSISQYVRQLWNSDTGLPASQVYTISQTPDGYLWIGTDGGLLRFDGLSFQRVPLPSMGSPSTTAVLAMLTDANGNLWVVQPGLGVFREAKGKLESVTAGHGNVLAQVTAILREANGSVLLSDMSIGMVRFEGGRSDVLAVPGFMPGSAPVISMAETPDGKIWMGSLGAGLFNLHRDAPSRFSRG